MGYHGIDIFKMIQGYVKDIWLRDFIYSPIGISLDPEPKFTKTYSD